MKELRIGTRRSPLALVQANMVRAAIEIVCTGVKVEIVKILTSGDWKPSDGETKLSEEAGGKGLFAKEIEQQLLDRKIDIAVHSMKDMESFLPDGLIIPWMLPREDARDAIICGDLAKNSQKIDDLPKGCTVGTSSVRRAAFLLNKRPDLKIEPFRGNVQTRLGKLNDGQVDVTLLAYAGLKRLALEQEATFIVSEDEMLPAAAQGAVGIEILSDRLNELSEIGQISCDNTVTCVGAEREVLRVLDGSCHTPIGAHATLEDGQMRLRAAVCSEDGKDYYDDDQTAAISSLKEAVKFGRKMGEKLKARLPEGFLS